MSLETRGYSPEKESENALEEFLVEIEHPETAEILPKVIAKIRKAEGPDGIRNEIKKLDKQITDTDGEVESLVAVLEAYVGKKVKTAESEEGDAEEDEVDDKDKEGWGTDNEDT